MTTPKKNRVALFYHTIPGYVQHFHNLAGVLSRKGFHTIAIATFDNDIFRNLSDPTHYDQITHEEQCIDSFPRVDVLFTASHIPANTPKDTTRVILSHRNAVSANDTENRKYPFVAQYMPTADFYIVAKDFNEHELIEAQNKNFFFPSSFIDNDRTNFTYVPAGYPKLDKLIADISSVDASDEKVISLATGHLSYSLMSIERYAEGVIHTLLTNFPEYTIVFRPHPGTREEPIIQHIQNTFSQKKNFEMDMSHSNINLYARSTLMISDGSFSGLSYSYATLRPVVSCVFREKKQPHFWMKEVGPIIRSPEDLVQNIQTLLRESDSYVDSITRSRQETITNVGRSTEYIGENIDAIIERTPPSDWKSYRIQRVQTGDIKSDCMSCFKQYVQEEDGDSLLQLGKRAAAQFPNDPYIKLAIAYGHKLRGSDKEAMTETLEALLLCEAELPREHFLTEFINDLDPKTILQEAAYYLRERNVGTLPTLRDFLRDSVALNKSFQNLLDTVGQEHVAREVGALVARIEEVLS